jgi:hypothetical protein
MTPSLTKIWTCRTTPPGEISGNTRRMMDQHFDRPTHASIGEDLMGLEDTLNGVL